VLSGSLPASTPVVAGKASVAGVLVSVIPGTAGKVGASSTGVMRTVAVVDPPLSAAVIVIVRVTGGLSEVFAYCSFSESEVTTALVTFVPKTRTLSMSRRAPATRPPEKSCVPPTKTKRYVPLAGITVSFVRKVGEAELSPVASSTVVWAPVTVLRM
jgi:hypothetical protein